MSQSFEVVENEYPALPELMRQRTSDLTELDYSHDDSFSFQFDEQQRISLERQSRKESVDNLLEELGFSLEPENTPVQETQTDSKKRRRAIFQKYISPTPPAGNLFASPIPTPAPDESFEVQDASAPKTQPTRQRRIFQKPTSLNNPKPNYQNLTPQTGNSLQPAMLNPNAKLINVPSVFQDDMSSEMGKSLEIVQVNRNSAGLKSVIIDEPFGSESIISNSPFSSPRISRIFGQSIILANNSPSSNDWGNDDKQLNNFVNPRGDLYQTDILSDVELSNSINCSSIFANAQNVSQIAESKEIQSPTNRNSSSLDWGGGSSLLNIPRPVPALVPANLFDSPIKHNSKQNVLFKPTAQEKMNSFANVPSNMPLFLQKVSALNSQILNWRICSLSKLNQHIMNSKVALQRALFMFESIMTKVERRKQFVYQLLTNLPVLSLKRFLSDVNQLSLISANDTESIRPRRRWEQRKLQMNALKNTLEAHKLTAFRINEISLVGDYTPACLLMIKIQKFLRVYSEDLYSEFICIDLPQNCYKLATLMNQPLSNLSMDQLETILSELTLLTDQGDAVMKIQVGRESKQLVLLEMARRWAF